MSQEASLALLHALLAVARDAGQRPRVLTALRGARVLAATWPHDPASLRTLTNSLRITALPVFSSPRQLEDAAARYGWLNVDNWVPQRSLPIAEAIRYAKQVKAQLVVVDIAADHALELDEGELELLSSFSGRPPSYEGLSVVSKSRPPGDGRDVKRVSTRPPAYGQPAEDHEAPMEPARSALRPSSVTPDPDHGGVSATFGASRTATMEELEEAPTEELFESLTAVLRDYPEVEWGCLVRADRGHGTPSPSVALRIEPAFRKHLTQISEKLQAAAREHGQQYDVLVLDTAEQMKLARGMGLPFYPWRKDGTRKK